MKQNLSSLEDKFIKNFSRIYSKPSKINKAKVKTKVTIMEE